MNYGEINYTKIEKHCREMVEFFNSVGLQTYESCEGHHNDKKFKYWVSFDVYDDDMLSFINRIEYHSELVRRFNNASIKKRPNGKFVKVYPFTPASKLNDLSREHKEHLFMPRWYYLVDTYADCNKNQKLAEEDLKMFRACYKEIEEGWT